MLGDTPSLLDYLPNSPVLPPPTGVISNFSHPQTYGNVIWAVGIISTAIAFVSVIIRLYSRTYVSRQPLWWDDWICVLAILGSIANTTLMIKSLEFGLGKHMWDIRASTLTHERLLVLLVRNDVVAITAYFVRMSVLLLNYRLFSVHKTARRLIWLGMIMCTVITITYIGVIIARGIYCSVPTAILGKSYCHTDEISTTVIVFETFNMLTDLYIYFIAINQLRGLQIDHVKKLACIILFGMSFVAVIMAFVRVVWVCVHFSDPDTLRYALWLGLFATLEVNIALLCSCAVFIPAVFREIRPSTTFSNSMVNSVNSNHFIRLGGGSGKAPQLEAENSTSKQALTDSMELEDRSTHRLTIDT